METPNSPTLVEILAKARKGKSSQPKNDTGSTTTAGHPSGWHPINWSANVGGGNSSSNTARGPAPDSLPANEDMGDDDDLASLFGDGPDDEYRPEEESTDEEEYTDGESVQPRAQSRTRASTRAELSHSDSVANAPALEHSAAATRRQLPDGRLVGFGEANYIVEPAKRSTRSSAHPGSAPQAAEPSSEASITSAQAAFAQAVTAHALSGSQAAEPTSQPAGAPSQPALGLTQTAQPPSQANPAAQPRYGRARRTDVATCTLPGGNTFKFTKMGRSVQEVWNEWHVGANGNPAVGHLETTHGTGWRSDQDANVDERKNKIKYRSNWVAVRRTIVDHVQSMMDANGTTAQAACASLDAVVQGRLQEMITCLRKKQDPLQMPPKASQARQAD